MAARQGRLPAVPTRETVAQYLKRWLAIHDSQVKPMRIYRRVLPGMLQEAADSFAALIHAAEPACIRADWVGSGGRTRTYDTRIMIPLL